MTKPLFYCAGFIRARSCNGLVHKNGELCARTDHDVWTQEEIDRIKAHAEEKYGHFFRDKSVLRTLSKPQRYALQKLTDTWAERPLVVKGNTMWTLERKGLVARRNVPLGYEWRLTEAGKAALAMPGKVRR